MEERGDDLGTALGLPPSVRFFYVKGHHFRVVHLDGVIGSLTPKGLIHCAVFNERSAIPQEQEIEITDQGRLGEVLTEEGKIGIVREVEVDLIFNKSAAVQLMNWLKDRLDEIAQIEEEVSDRGKT